MIVAIVPIDEVVYFDECTHSTTTGESTDADDLPTFEIFEESTTTAFLTGSMVQRGTGDYYGTFTASTANGFEAGKYYNVISTGAVEGITGKKKSGTFRCGPAETVAGAPSVYVIGNGDKTGYALGSTGIDAIVDAIKQIVMVEPVSAPAVAATLVEALSWMFTLSRNRILQTPTVQTLTRNDNITAIATSIHSDNGSLHVRGKFT